jgi:hypothetical protein
MTIKTRLEKLEHVQTQVHGCIEVQGFTHNPITGLYRSDVGKYYTEAEFEALQPAGLAEGEIWCIIAECPGVEHEED